MELSVPLALVTLMSNVGYLYHERLRRGPRAQGDLHVVR